MPVEEHNSGIPLTEPPADSAYIAAQRASSYDKQAAKLAPVYDALYLLIRLVLFELPADARILCVGVGTGSELVALAQAFPQWRFTAVEPAAPMLDICRQKAKDYCNSITKISSILYCVGVSTF